MTISATRRREEQTQILVKMLAALKDGQMLHDARVDRESPDFADFAATSFVELDQQGLIEWHRAMRSTSYYLTPRGWLEALQLTGAIDAPAFRERCVTLVRFLKRAVKGRSLPFDLPVSHRETAAKTGIPFPWILTALQCGLLQELLPGDQITAYWDSSGTCIRVPPTFGMDWIDPVA